MPNIPGVTGYVHPKVWGPAIPPPPKYTPVQMAYLYFCKWASWNTFRGARRDGNTIIVTWFNDSSDVFEEVILKPNDV